MKAPMALDLAVSFTPPGSDVALTLATVKDPTLLRTVLEFAIADAERQAESAREPFSARAHRVKHEFLKKCLAQLRPETVM